MLSCSPLRGSRVVHVTARVMSGRAARSCWQIVVLPPPDGAEITTRSGLTVPAFCFSSLMLVGGMSSFDVLRLFAKFFQLRLQDHDLTRDERVVGFRADRVDFAIHLLRQKIQRPSDRLLRLHAIGKLLEVTLQTGEFL